MGALEKIGSVHDSMACKPKVASSMLLLFSLLFEKKGITYIHSS